MFCGLAAILLTHTVRGEESPDECRNLPESQQPLCLMVQACALIEDEERRQGCFRVAAESLQDAEDLATPPTVAEETPSKALPAEPQAVDESVREAPTPPTPAPAEEQYDSPDTATDEATSSTQEVVERPSTLKTIGRLFTRSRAQDPSDAIPKRFVAKVTVRRDLVRDRQLVVLDDKLLFEGDNAASSRIKVGDEVDVVKISSLRGRRYQITGPSRRAFSALRIRCERADLSPDNRRKCEGTLANP